MLIKVFALAFQAFSLLLLKFVELFQYFQAFSLLPLKFVELFQYFNERFEIVVLLYVMAFVMFIVFKAIALLVGVSVMFVEVIVM
jgi:hypothetical protein